MRNLDHQTQVGPDHQRARLAITPLDLSGQLDLLLWSQKRDLPDLAQVNLYSCIAIFSSHITLFHRSFGRIGSTTSRIPYSSKRYRSRVVPSQEVFNKVKYSNLLHRLDACRSIFFIGVLLGSKYEVV